MNIKHFCICDAIFNDIEHEEVLMLYDVHTEMKKNSGKFHFTYGKFNVRAACWNEMGPNTKSLYFSISIAKHIQAIAPKKHRFYHKLTIWDK